MTAPKVTDGAFVCDSCKSSTMALWCATCVTEALAQREATGEERGRAAARALLALQNETAWRTDFRTARVEVIAIALAQAEAAGEERGRAAGFRDGILASAKVCEEVKRAQYGRDQAWGVMEYAEGLISALIAHPPEPKKCPTCGKPTWSGPQMVEGEVVSMYHRCPPEPKGTP